MSKYTLKSRGYITIRQLTVLCGLPKSKEDSVRKTLVSMGYIKKNGKASCHARPYVCSYYVRKPYANPNAFTLDTNWTPLISPRGISRIVPIISRKYNTEQRSNNV